MGDILVISALALACGALGAKFGSRFGSKGKNVGGIVGLAGGCLLGVLVILLR